MPLTCQIEFLAISALSSQSAIASRETSLHWARNLGDCQRICRRALNVGSRGIYEPTNDPGNFAISSVPLSAQGLAKLKADAQKIVSMISADKAKTRAYCEIESLAPQIERAAQEKDEKKTDALTQKIDGLEKQLGPEYLALFELLDEADPNSSDVHEILSMFDKFGQSCPD
jgi:hypothetical protein